MTFIAAGSKSRVIAKTAKLTVAMSEHADRRMKDRYAYVAPADTDLDRFVTTGIIQSLVAKTATQTAPLDYYDDGVARDDSDCYYAVAELRPGMPVCIVFAASGNQIIVITVISPLDKGGARETSAFGRTGARARQTARANNIGGQGRVRRAS